jgi:hypothetical protein
MYLICISTLFTGGRGSQISDISGDFKFKK